VLDERGFGQFFPQSGIPIMDLDSANKQVRANYFVRYAPQFSAGTNEYTAASRERRITASGVQRLPKFTVRTNNRTNVRTIRLKKGDFIFAGNISQFEDDPEFEELTRADRRAGVILQLERGDFFFLETNATVTLSDDGDDAVGDIVV